MPRSTLLLSAILLSARIWAAPAENAPSAEPPPEATSPVAPAPLAALPVPTSAATVENWAQTLERIASGVVTIQIDSTRAFDTEWNTTAQATGFVIDAKRGLILTNRHVVTPGPVTAQALFLNREEVQLYPIYRDPIHAFAFFLSV